MAGVSETGVSYENDELWYRRVLEENEAEEIELEI